MIKIILNMNLNKKYLLVFFDLESYLSMTKYMKETYFSNNNI